MSGFVLSIDQGTTSTRSIVFDDMYTICGSHQMEFTQYFPKSGWVEHNADEIWSTVVDTAKAAISGSGIAASDIAAIGLSLIHI